MNKFISEGTAIINDDKLGQILIATKDFEIGDLIIQELPLVVYPIEKENSTNVPTDIAKETLHFDLDYLEALYELNDLKRAKILSLFHPSLERYKHGVNFRRGWAGQLHQYINNNEPKLKRHKLSIDLIYKYIIIRDMKGISLASFTADIHDTHDMGSILEYSSKIQHSCIPNMIDKITKNTCFIQYYAIKPIKTGDYLYYSYIPDMYNNIYTRRLEILKKKNFTCNCILCSDQDYTFAFKCCRLHCTGIVLLHTDTDIYTCSICGQNSESSLSEPLNCVQDICKELCRLKELSFYKVKLSIIHKLAIKASNKLFDKHFLVTNILMFYSYIASLHIIHTSHFEEAEKLVPGSILPKSCAPYSCIHMVCIGCMYMYICIIVMCSMRYIYVV